jgi:hypothetical protein
LCLMCRPCDRRVLIALVFSQYPRHYTMKPRTFKQHGDAHHTPHDFNRSQDYDYRKHATITQPTHHSSPLHILCLVNHKCKSQHQKYIQAITSKTKQAKTTFIPTTRAATHHSLIKQDGRSTSPHQWDIPAVTCRREEVIGRHHRRRRRVMYRQR